MELRTSSEWESLVPKDWKLVILDPDGWDRGNYEYSYSIEKISKQEFMNRVSSSTIRCDIKMFNDNNTW